MADLFDIVVARKLSGGGGGGSSDFSTAEVTITNNGGHLARFVSPVILGNDTISPEAPLASSNATTFKVVLYKDACYNEIVIIDTINNDLVEPSSLSGNVAYDDEEMTYTITGDCTITIISGGGYE